MMMTESSGARLTLHKCENHGTSTKLSTKLSTANQRRSEKGSAGRITAQSDDCSKGDENRIFSSERPLGPLENLVNELANNQTVAGCRENVKTQTRLCVKDCCRHPARRAGLQTCPCRPSRSLPHSPENCKLRSYCIRGRWDEARWRNFWHGVDKF